MITQVELKNLLHYDPASGIFTWLVSPTKSVKVGSAAGTLRPTGYLHIQIKGKQYYAHRLVWLYTNGQWPKDQIDHRNHVRDDSCIDNLRESTRMQNQCNMRTNTSGVPGVTWHKQKSKWHARIGLGKTSKNLGFFTNLPDAADARRAAEMKYHGVNALLITKQ